MCTSASSAFKHIQTHLTKQLPLCRARRRGLRHTGTVSRIPPLLSAVHQRTYAHVARSHGHGVRASPSATPTTLFGFLIQMLASREKTDGCYTSEGVESKGMILLAGNGDILLGKAAGQRVRLTHNHTHKAPGQR